ncbi:MAG: N-acetyltransferase family protein [Planctomycetota bacterium]
MIRIATADDAAAVREIYRPAIEDSVISFETEIPTIEEIQGRIQRCLQSYPWLVYEDEQGVCGYAYAGPHHSRAAYRWTANVSVYVGPNAHRRGIASRLYSVLFAILRLQQVRKVTAGISVPNPASQAFHQALGFRQIGLYPQVGFKLGQWLDVSWWLLDLHEDQVDRPADFLSLPDIKHMLLGDLSHLGQ